MRSMRVSRLPPSAMRPCAPGPEDAESTDGYGQRGRERCADRPEERPADRFARCPAADLAFQAAGSLGRLCVFPGRWRLCCCAEGRLTFPLGQPAHWAHRAACPEQGRWVAGGDGYRRIRTARIGGREGRLFSIYWGQVSADSDGAGRMVQAGPAAETEEFAEQFPELGRRPRHRRQAVLADARRPWCADHLSHPPAE
jgi:hypothetical protein